MPFDKVTCMCKNKKVQFFAPQCINKLERWRRTRSFDAPQQHMYNRLARSADYLIFAREWTRPPAGKSFPVRQRLDNLYPSTCDKLRRHRRRLDSLASGQCSLWRNGAADLVTSRRLTSSSERSNQHIVASDVSCGRRTEDVLNQARLYRSLFQLVPSWCSPTPAAEAGGPSSPQATPQIRRRPQHDIISPHHVNIHVTALVSSGQQSPVK